MATVIKAGTAHADPRAMNCSTFNFEDMSTEARDFMAKIKQQAAEILKKAEEEGEQIKAQRREQGRREGVELARQEMLAQLQSNLKTLLPALQQTINEIADSKAALLERWERGAVDLSIAIAEKIVRRELQQRPDITVDLLRETLELAAGMPDITIHLSPPDYECLAEEVKGVTRNMTSIGKATVVADPSITPGGVRVETGFGEIDQRIESQLQRIEEELTR